MTLLYPPGEVESHPDLQSAASVRYSSAVVCFFAEIRPDVFCLYDFRRNVVAIVDTWDEVLTHYRARPPYVPHRGAPSITPSRKTFSGVDLSKLEFKL